MPPFVRWTVAIGLLPFTVTILVPMALHYPRLGSLSISSFRLLLGLPCLTVGFGILAWTAGLFGTYGKGTLAPWDPPKHLVTTGPYRCMRNPMMVGVLLILLSEGILLNTVFAWGWLSLLLLMNLIFIPLVEEPQLQRRFGTKWDEYRKRVKRWGIF